MSARAIVTSRMAEQARRFPELPLEALNTAHLDPRDAALAWAIDHAVARRWLTLVAVIESRLTRPWPELEAKMQAALLTGAAQLLLLDRLPDHAVINEAVEWAKQHVRPKAGGLVNAVLRKVAALRKELIAAVPPTEAGVWDRHVLPLGDGRAWMLNEPVFDDARWLRLAQQTSHPQSLIIHLNSLFGEEKAAMIAQHDLIQPPTIVHGIEDQAPAIDHLQPHAEPGFFIVDGDRESLGRLFREHPNAIVQDPTSAAAVMATSALDPRPAFIIDACAGMGTKTRQLAAMHPQATIIATDIAEKRSDILRQQFAGHARVRIVEHRQLGEFTGEADLVLLDVPCSNSGVFARRVEAKYRFSRTSLDQLVDLQRQIIADALPLLSDRGRLVYATCSIDPAENHKQVQWLCKWHPMQVVTEHARLPTGVPGEPRTIYADGGYYAVLQRVAKGK